MKKLTTQEFIQKAKQVHGDKYDYSLVEYINGKTKVKIICKEHGVFEQRPNDHLHNIGCSSCGGVAKLTTEEFIEKARKVHGDKYDYSLVEYIKGKTKVKIICPIHGLFEQIPNAHLRGQNCGLCCGKYKLTKEQFIEKAKLVHGNKYDYSLVVYKRNDIKVKIICSKHGVFEQVPSGHLRGRGCPICKSSKGEQTINDYLTSHNISFETQKRFKDCKVERTLPFDFYLSTFNTCIEYDGLQHFVGWNKSKESLQFIQHNDQIKTEYCQNHNIKLIRISYKDDISTILDNFLLDIDK